MPADLLYGWDAEVCPDPLPDDSLGGIVEFYLGGSSAAHKWTPGERARIAHLPRLPIWVPTPGLDNPRQAALLCARLMRADLGLIPVHDPAQPRKGVIVDLETGKEPDPRWQRVFSDVIHAHGFGTLIYASLDIVYDYEPRLGYIVAHYDGAAVLPDHPGVIGKQFRAAVDTPGGTVDLDCYDPRIIDHVMA